MANLVERRRNDIRNDIRACSRVSTVWSSKERSPSIYHPKALATMLNSQGIYLFDYTQFVQPFRDAIRAHAEKIAAEEGVTVEYIRRSVGPLILMVSAESSSTLHTETPGLRDHHDTDRENPSMAGGS